jgi:hypothetical protein
MDITQIFVNTTISCWGINFRKLVCGSMLVCLLYWCNKTLAWTCKSIAWKSLNFTSTRYDRLMEWDITYITKEVSMWEEIKLYSLKQESTYNMLVKFNINKSFCYIFECEVYCSFGGSTVGPISWCPPLCCMRMGAPEHREVRIPFSHSMRSEFCRNYICFTDFLIISLINLAHKASDLLY